MSLTKKIPDLNKDKDNNSWKFKVQNFKLRKQEIKNFKL